MPPIRTDALVIGAGPVGLFQVFQLGLQGIRAHVVDALPHAGGQPVELYADKAIYDIPAIPFCTGQTLIDNLCQQAAPFGAAMHFGHEVSTLACQPDGRFAVGTSQGLRFDAATVFIAAGVGAFRPKRLKLPGLEAFEPNQVIYHLAADHRLAQQHVVVVGGDDTALNNALRLSEAGPHRAALVTLIHRRDAFQADPATVAAVRTRCEAGALTFRVGQLTGFASEGQRLKSVQLASPQGETQHLTLDTLLVCQGLSPSLGPVASWGLAMARKQLVVNPATFATEMPGIFAVGDVNTYPGKRKLIVCGFHESTLAAYAAAALLHPGQPDVQLYTSSSTRLQGLLGLVPTGGTGH